MKSDLIAAIFPGQGSHCPEMMHSMQTRPGWNRLSLIASEIGGIDVAEIIKSCIVGKEKILLNEISSLLTVLSSLLWLDEIGRERFSFFAGYSVGHWSALCAAGVCTEEIALKAVWSRAKLMNRSPASKGKMLAIIGCKQEDIEEACAIVKLEVGYVAISNYNSPGNFTIAGESAAITEIKKYISVKSQRVVDIRTAGAWHCNLLTPILPQYKAYLDNLSLHTPNSQIISNVTGEILPPTPTEIKEDLLLQLSSPVMWQQGIQTLINKGANYFIEVGYGNMLSNFGFFINRDLQYSAIEPNSKKVTQHSVEQKL
jgi:[acyl-carrier-protein] S-malonyltransferase